LRFEYIKVLYANDNDFAPACAWRSCS
jgi:hypothetical protein